MASGSTVSGDSQEGSRMKRREVPSGYIEGQLEKTSGEVRLIEISISILTICVTVLLYLLVLGVVEHWFVTGGISALTRTLLLIGLVVGLSFYVRDRLFPYFRYRISLAYAAHTIEQSEPRLKNSLLNFLFLRRQKQGVQEVVLRGLEQQAATGLSRVSVDLSLERRRLVHLGIVVIAIIFLGGLYTVFSPKSLVPEIGRMLVPWAEIDAATRVKIENIQPGTKKVPLRSRVDISAEVKGLREGEPVAIVFSSAGGGAVDQRIPMRAGPDSDDYAARLADSEKGIVSDLTYRIEAGDASSKEYQLEVIPAPSFQVQSVEYRYPPYTGLENRTVREVGDLRAIEGTQVHLHAQSTDEIAAAWLHLMGERDGLKDRPVRMDVDGHRAACQFKLCRKPVDGDSIPEFSTYHLSLKTPSGGVNQNKVRHQISILRDQPPLVEILDPQESTVEVREDAALSFEVRSRDPDFRLTELWLVGHQGERERFKIDLLGRSKRVGEPLRAVHRESTRLVPQAWGLQAGETLSVFAVAIDNKQPDANRSETASLRVRILPSLPGSRQENTSPSPDKNKEASQTKDQAGNSAGQAESGQAEKSDAGGQQGAGSGPEDDAAEGEASAEEQDGKNQQNNAQDGGQSKEQHAGAGSTGAENTEGQSSEAEGTEQDSGEQGKSGQQGNNGQSPSTSAAGQPRDESSADRGDSSGDPQGEDQNQGGAAENSAAKGKPNTTSAENQSGRAGQPSGQGEQASARTGTEGAESSKVDNDGDAFEQLSDIIQQKSSSDKPSSSDAPSSSDEAGESDASAAPSTSPPSSGSTEADQEKSTEKSPTGGQKGSAQSASKQDQSEQAQPKQDSGQAGSGRSKPNPQQKREGSGESDRIGEAQEKPASETERSSDASAEASRDEAGGGTGNAGEQPPPPAEGQGQDRRKSGSTQQDPQQEEEPSDGGVSKRDSDSAQGQEGSRHGKGKEGGGQQSQQEGEGAAGANTPSDAGKGSSPESGQGDSGSAQGNGEKSEQPTGQKGEQPGAGSTQGPADSGSESPGQRGNASSAPSQQVEGGAQPPKGGGGEGTAPEPENVDGLIEPGADKANLEYANQTTDLVLDYLEKQLDQGGIDADLKKRFGWTDQDFADFVQRYRTLKQEAQLPGQEGGKGLNKWDTVLRSLGLTPPQRDSRTTSVQSERAAGLRETGRSLPPQEDQDRFDAFRRDVLAR